METDMGDRTIEELTAKLDELEDLGNDIPDFIEVQEKIAELRGRAEALIRERPLVAVGAAILVGYLIGRLLSSDDTD
jgi:ElaB/YqjD/DUF883 family membrane-anchored ribosome-binding protein